MLKLFTIVKRLHLNVLCSISFFFFFLDIENFSVLCALSKVPFPVISTAPSLFLKCTKSIENVTSLTNTNEVPKAITRRFMNDLSSSFHRLRSYLAFYAACLTISWKLKNSTIFEIGRYAYRVKLYFNCATNEL